MKSIHKLQILILTIFFIPILGSSLQASVIAKGQAEIFSNNIVVAKKQALRNALRSAVEKSVGVILDSKTLVKNWRVLRDEVYTSSQGLIKSYDIVTSEKKGNVWYVTIKAEMAKKTLQDKLKALRILHKKMGNKRYVLFYLPSSDSSFTPNSNIILEATSVISNKLNKAGFRLFKADALQSAYNKKIETNRTDTNQQAAAKKLIYLARENQTDIVVTFDIRPLHKSRMGTSIYVTRVFLHTTAYRVSSGRVIASFSITQKQLTNARNAGTDLQQAQLLAARRAANASGDKLINRIENYYEQTDDIGNAYLIRLNNFNDDQEDILIGILRELEGSKSLSELQRKDNFIEIEYFSDLETSTIGRRFRVQAKKKWLRLKTEESKGNQLTFSNLQNQ